MIELIAAALLASAAPADDEQLFGAWKLVTIADPITDESRFIASLRGEAGSLSVKCDEPGLSNMYVQFTSTEFLGEGSRGRFRDVTLRFGQRAPTVQRWRYGDAYAFQADGGSVALIVADLSSTGRLALRATTYRYEEITAVFEASAEDTRAALTAVYAGCGAGEPPFPPLVAAAPVE